MFFRKVSSGFLIFFLFLIIFSSQISFSSHGFKHPSRQENQPTTISQTGSAPSLTITEPENLSVLSGWFFITVTAVDDIAVDKVIYRERGSLKELALSQNDTETSKFRAIVDSRTFSNGIKFFEIIANDTSNNQTLVLLILAFQNLEVEADIYVYNASRLIKDCPCLTDSNVSFFWTFVPAKPIPEYGGYIKFAHNFSHIFGIFVYDSSLTWISLQFDNDGDGICMENGEDIWWFLEGGILADYTANSFNTPIPDIDQDLEFEKGMINETESNLEFFEMMRPFKTDEVTDVEFTFTSPIGIIFASNAVHQGGVRANFSLALSSKIPENLTDTDPLETSGLHQSDRVAELLIFGGLGLGINVVIILGLLYYNKRRH
ncbi:MAG: hypothetical protein ACW98G_10610 [Candidatus Hodarchaeales archaeon]|jgi:hypothetical protein